MEYSKKNMTNMTAGGDIEQFWDVIMELRHGFNNPSLEDEILHLTKKATPSKRFLIKMEIMNLSKNVQRVIDLRNFFQDNCEKFIYQGIAHFFDEAAKNEFIQEIQKYGGEYTLGVYEFILRKAKKRYKFQQNNSPVAPGRKAEEISLTKFFQRKDERLFFIKKISFFYNSPEKMSKSAFENFAIQGITTDISATGLSIKVPEKNVRRRNGLIHVWMHGIESEFKFSDRIIITYQIRKTFAKNEHIYLSLELHNEQFSKTKNEFNIYLKNYIDTQNKRNNVHVENTLNAIKVKIAEQFVISRLNSLPIFLLHHDKHWLPAAQFNTAHNTQIGLITKTTDNKDFLRALCVLPAIQSKIALGARFSNYLFLMPIKNNNNKTYYVALPHNDVIGNRFIKKIAREAHRHNSLRLYRIDGNTLSPETQCHVPSSLPSSAGEVFENMNQKPIKKALELTIQLKRMLVISDISDCIDSLNLLKETAYEKDSAVNLLEYILKKPTSSIAIHETFAETNDFRIEDRFLYEMSLLIKPKELQKNVFISCCTLNISTRGLKIQLPEIMDLNVGQELVVYFPELQDRTNNEGKYQSYYIVGKDSDLQYRLLIVGNAKTHNGRKMLNKFIHKNLNDLKAMGYENEIYGFSRVLRNLFANNLHLAHGIAAKKGTARYIKYLAISENTALQELNNNSKNNLLSLMDNSTFSSSITNQIGFTNKEKPYEYLYFIVMPKTKSNGESYFFIKQIVKSTKDYDLNKIIQDLRCIGNPRLLKICVTKKSRVFNKYFRDEVAYIEKFAKTKLKYIDSEIRNTMGIFELADITELVALPVKNSHPAISLT